MKKILFILLCITPYVTWADDTTPKKTPCATAAFEQGLRDNASNISENSTKAEIEQFIMDVFSDKTTLENVLKCSEINQKDDDDVITFDTITYEFPSKQTVTINYETQPKILKQRLELARKPRLPSNDQSALLSDDVSPNGTIWTYTDPAWYGIMVTQHGALANYVNKGIETNTISLATIIAHIDELYPQGANCTSRSAFAEDWCAINRAVTKTAGIDNPATQNNEDSNDYYVAGDINLAWIGYAEMVLDIAITVATVGGGQVITGVAKGARASRALKGMIKSLETLRKTDHVKDYVKKLSYIAKLQDEIKTLDKVKDATKIADKTKEIEALTDATNIEKNITRVEKELKAAKKANNAEDIASKQKELDNLKDLKDYDEKIKTFSDVNQYRRELTGITRLKKLPKQRGNIIARGVKTGSKATKTIWKSAKAAWGGSDILNKGQKMGRASKLSTRISDRLFHFTMKNAAALGKMQTLSGTVYGGLIAAGKLMYNFTETSTGDFTNNIQFNPFLLLSADDIPEGDQADKVNYGMWLMWMGDSYSPADDDAAYLQAMDFAAKFYEDLMEVQGETNSPCNVDIYVVKPIIKNPGQANPELHYLIMNEVPWTTAQ